MTNILGISAFYHESAACLVRDGEFLWGNFSQNSGPLCESEKFPATSCLSGAVITRSRTVLTHGSGVAPSIDTLF